MRKSRFGIIALLAVCCLLAVTFDFRGNGNAAVINSSDIDGSVQSEESEIDEESDDLADDESDAGEDAVEPDAQDAIALWEGNIPYEDESPGQRPTLTPCIAENTDIAVVVCPGGAYRARNGSRSVEKRMQRKGISAFVLSYRLAPCNMLAPLADAQRAIRLVRSMGYKYVGILGLSAGGHLACTAATHWDLGEPESEDPIARKVSRPDFFVACYPVVSFWRYPEQRSAQNLLGSHVDDEEWLKFFSAELNVTSDTPPGYIWHCAGDQVVSPLQSLLLSQALAEKGVFHELHIFPGGAHGIGLAKSYPHIKSWATECVEFIRLVCA